MSEQVIIKLTVLHEGVDCFYLEKTAPKLPNGVMWHEGLILELESNGEEFLSVDGVVLKLDGSVNIDTEFVMSGDGWGEMTKPIWWERRGWRQRNQNE